MRWPWQRAEQSPTVDEARGLLDDWVRNHRAVTQQLQAEAHRLDQQQQERKPADARPGKDRPRG